MINLYLFSLFILPLAIYFPYHISFLSLMIFGIPHIYAELTYFFSEKKILRKRKSYPPILLLGAVILTAIGVGQNLQSGENGSSTFYNQIFFFGISIYFFLSILAGVWNRLEIKSNQFKIHPINFLFYLGISITFLTLIFYFPLIFVFLLIHLHNWIPWFFMILKKGKKILIHFVLLAILLPIIGYAIHANFDFLISTYSLSYELEVDLFEYVYPEIFPFSPTLSLLSFFGYSQSIHYFLWILVLPESKFPDRFMSFFSEVLFFLGFPKKIEKLGPAILILFYILSILLFINVPVEWRKEYLILSAAHVYLEFPVLFLEIFSNSTFSDNIAIEIDHS